MIALLEESHCSVPPSCAFHACAHCECGAEHTFLCSVPLVSALETKDIRARTPPPPPLLRPRGVCALYTTDGAMFGGRPPLH